MWWSLWGNTVKEDVVLVVEEIYMLISLNLCHYKIKEIFVVVVVKAIYV